MSTGITILCEIIVKSSTFISLLRNRHKLGTNVGQIFNALTNNFLYDKIKIEDMDVDKL